MKTEVTNFQEMSLYIGLDVHKKQWSVSIYTTTAHHRTFSQPPTPGALKTIWFIILQVPQLSAPMRRVSLGIGSSENLLPMVTGVWLSIPRTFPPQIRNHRRRPIPVTAAKLERPYGRVCWILFISPSRARKGTDNFFATARNFGQIWYGLRTGSRINFCFQAFPFRRSMITAIGQRPSCYGSNKWKCPTT